MTACVNSLPYSGVLLIVVVSLMSIYTVEAGCRFYVERMAYFKSPWNLLDLLVAAAAEWVRPVHGLRIWILEGLTQTGS